MSLLPFFTVGGHTGARSGRQTGGRVIGDDQADAEKEKATFEPDLGEDKRGKRLARDADTRASLGLHLHQVGQGTFTPKLSDMPGTQEEGRSETGLLSKVTS